MRKYSRRTATAGVATAVAVASGVAWASWLTTGSGTASGQAGEAVSVDVVGVSVGQKLVPGRTGDVGLSVHNPNTYRIHITRVRLSDETVGITADKTGCANTGVEFPVTPVNSNPLNRKIASVNWFLDAGLTGTFTMFGQVRMTNASDNACQDAVFTIPVALTAELA